MYVCSGRCVRSRNLCVWVKVMGTPRSKLARVVICINRRTPLCARLGPVYMACVPMENTIMWVLWWSAFQLILSRLLCAPVPDAAPQFAEAAGRPEKVKVVRFC